MALTNAERQRKHRQIQSAKLKKLSDNPLYSYVELLDNYLDTLSLTDYQEILDFGLLHFDPDFVSTFDDQEKYFLLSAVKIGCRDRLQKASNHD